MAPTASSNLKFYFGTSTQYGTATKDANALYFLTDTKQVYLGSDLYSGSVVLLGTNDEFPNSPSQGILYCKPSTHEVKMWNGTAWEVIVPEVVSSIVATGENATPETALANVGAIKSYVSAQIGSAYTITKADVADDGYVATYQLFKGDTAVGDKINIPRDFLVKSASMGTCAQANVPLAGLAVGDPYLDFVINTKEGSFVPATGTYVEGVTYYTDATGTQTVDTSEFIEGTTSVAEYYVAAPDSHIYINVATLVDTYTVGDTASLDLTMDANNNITGAVRISDNTGNVLSIVETNGHEGLFVERYIGSVADTNSVDLDVTGKELTASVKLSDNSGNIISTVSTEGHEGLFAEHYIGSIEDTTTVDLDVTNKKLTAAVKVSSTAGNIISSDANGLYASVTWNAIA